MRTRGAVPRLVGRPWEPDDGRGSAGEANLSGSYLQTQPPSEKPADRASWVESAVTGTVLPCTERARFALLSLRLRKVYFGYCVLCFVLSALACGSSFRRAANLGRGGTSLSSHRWEVWESTLEVMIGIMVCTETLSSMWLMGRKAFFRDWWCVYDAVVVVLTLVTWFLLGVRQVLLEADVLKQVDLPLLALRFLMQPCRLLSAISVLRRVKQMQQSTVDIIFDGLETEENALLQTESRILFPTLQAEIKAHLPAWCRFRRWTLAYSPHVHGTSLQTFYRSQAGRGANVLLVREPSGNIFGCFSTEPWQHCTSGFHGSGECFVFTTATVAASPKDKARSSPTSAGATAANQTSGEEVCHVFHTDEHGEVLMWGDADAICMAGAIELRDDFRCGSTAACPTFNSPCLTGDGGVVCGGSEFLVSSFECWQLDRE